jgi:para-aminobenzoate N-oxygenase AurF
MRVHHNFNFKDVLAAQARGAWEIEDVLPAGSALDFSRRFMPEALARTAVLPLLGEDEARILNQIRGHEYLALFGLVEEFILPFVLDHARPQLNGEDYRVRALLAFASEEAKHIHLFRKFHGLFTEGFGTPCAVIGPAEAIAAEVLRHDPLAVALVILMIEWMTQNHYVDSVKDDGDLDPLFRSLLKHHWMEEAQHAKLDTLMVEALAAGRSEDEIQKALDGFLAIGTFLDRGLAVQTSMNLDAFEAATGRRLSARERKALQGQQHQALRWTYLGSGMIHPKFVATLAAMSPAARDRIAAVAPAFA